MFLEDVAERWANEPLEAFDPVTLEFVPTDFIARISLVDRFLSNFNRPLRRRMFHYSPKLAVPGSRTVRVPSTGDVYLLGQARRDSHAGEQYHEMAVGHMVTDEGPNGSSGLANLGRYAPSGPAEDPGWVTQTPNGVAWCDIEFRTSLNEPDLAEERTEAFISWFPLNTDIRPHDMVTLQGHEYRVTDAYPDSGFIMARLDKEQTYFADLIIKVLDGTRYDENLRRYVADEKEYQVSVILSSEHDYVTWGTDSDDSIALAIDEEYIGFRPKPGMVVVYEGRERTIRQVSYYRGERQYKVRCR